MNLQEINSTISKIKNKNYSPIYFLMGEETYYIDLISDLLENCNHYVIHHENGETKTNTTIYKR
jgi:hypothetical protein